MIAISWLGLPLYAARLLRAFCDQTEEDVCVIGVRPDVPVRGMETALGRPIVWIPDTASSLSWHALGQSVPDVFVQSGWTFRPFVMLGKEVKRAGGRVIGLCDNNYRGDLRQVIGALLFRVFYRKNFDAMLVPGQSAQKLMVCYGVPLSRIGCGMYGADPQLFRCATSLSQRPKQFLFVGQFIKRKGVDVLCEAFSLFQKTHPDWTLRFCGCGELRAGLSGRDGIIVDDFCQADELVHFYAQSRFLVLPSRQENWGLVVHEATLCGCALILSNRVGSACDLACEKNAICVPAVTVRNLYQAFTKAVNWSDAQLRTAQAVSFEKSRQFGPARFAVSLQKLINDLC